MLGPGECGDFASDYRDNDIAVLISNDDLNVEPSPFVVDAHEDPELGNAVLHVGYGATSGSDDECDGRSTNKSAVP